MIKIANLINVQSCADIKLHFATDRLNVIVADNNNVGKSVFFKILKLSVNKKIYDVEEYRDLIRWGCDFCQLSLIFTDGSMAYTKVFLDRVEYFYRQSKESEPILSMYPIPEVIAQCGMYVSPKFNFIGNFMDTTQSRLFVDKNLKENYECTRILVSDERLNELEESTEIKEKQYNAVIRNLDRTLMTKQQELSSYQYYDITELTRELAYDKASFNVGYTLVDIADTLDSIQVIEYKDYKSLVKVAECLDVLIDVIQELEDIKVVASVDQESLKAVETLAVFEEIAIDLSSMKFIGSVKNELNVANTLYSIEQIQECLEGIHILDSVHDSIKALEVINTLFSIKYNLPEIIPETNSVELNKVADVLDSLFTISDLLYEIEATVLDNIEVKASIDELRIKMSTYKVVDNCPIYGKVWYEDGKCLPYSYGSA